jgi:hypothetical protein
VIRLFIVRVPVLPVQSPIPTWLVDGLGPVTVIMQPGLVAYVPLVQLTTIVSVELMVNVIYAFWPTDVENL